MTVPPDTFTWISSNEAAILLAVLLGAGAGLLWYSSRGPRPRY